ncbi:U-actitoxin-Avd9a-like isoform X2 [Stylophora pistillata]|uniref:U-actitoxin-Avd9a-like isoform X2 n=1 Tax=Stylophora pistillata TaxID=50429 RepID=UPI000C044DFE|nr:U-actitoxin-Avd9a-like isoform X2 [Stylophora pistillata]
MLSRKVKLHGEFSSLCNMKILIVLLATMLVCSANSGERERNSEVLDSKVLDSGFRESRSCGDRFPFQACSIARRVRAHCKKLYYKIGCRRMCGLC